jgi:ESS family glutamate:Na+ symporter
MNSEQLFHLIIYLGYLGAFLLLGQFLRTKIRLFQNLFLPASIIGGFIALALGPHALGYIPKDIANTWSVLPETLISVVFACIFIGNKLPELNSIWVRAGAGVTFAYVQASVQWILGLGLAALVIAPIWELHPGVGSIIEVGWFGGSGTAAGMTPVYNDFGHPEIAALGIASATIGLVYSIVMGIVLINYAVRKGYTKVLKTASSFREVGSSGILRGDATKPFGRLKFESFAADHLTLQLAVVLIAVVLGWLTRNGLAAFLPIVSSIPVFPFAMVAGLFMQMIFVWLKIDDLLDKATITRISGTALDFLIISSVATVSLNVVITYFFPLMILIFAASSFSVWVTFWLGPKMYPEDWFECAMGDFGVMCGTVASGLLLTRIVDPENKTVALEVFAYKRPFVLPLVGGLSVSTVMAFRYGPWPVIFVWIGSLILSLVISKACGWFIYSRPKGQVSVLNTTSE